MSRFNSPDKLAAQRKLKRDRFGGDMRQQLESFGLSVAAIDELDRIVDLERAILLYSRDVPDADIQRSQLEALRDQLDRTKIALHNIHEATLRSNFDLWAVEMFFEQNLIKLSELIDQALQRKGEPGNRKTDLDVLVWEIAKVMVKHGLQPIRNGKQFRDIVSLVFQHIGEDPKSVEAAVTRAWGPTLASPRRSMTIKWLLGLPDDYDWDCADSECPDD